MARIRSVHPGIFTDEAFVSVELSARLLYIGLWTEADDYGVFEWKPLTLKMRLFAADQVDVSDLLDQLAGAGLIRRFEAQGKSFGGIRNFCRYQRPRMPKSLFPLPDGERAFVAADAAPAASGSHEADSTMSHARDVTAAERKRRQRERERQDEGACHALNVTDAADVTAETGQFPKNSEVSRQMEDGEYKEERKNSLGASAPSEPAPPDPFEDFWSVYPKRDGPNPKKPARQAFERAVKRGSPPERIIAAARKLVSQHPKPTRFCPQAATWLNQDRHADLVAEEAAKPVRAMPSWFSSPSSEDDWRRCLTMARSRSKWFFDEWGPAPHDAGCRVPSRMLDRGDERCWSPGSWEKAA